VRMREIQDDGDKGGKGLRPLLGTYRRTEDSPVRAVQIKSDKNRLVTVKPNIVASPKAAANSL